MESALELVEGLLLPTEGHVIVELIDADTGRVVQREEGDNFISLQAIKVAKWWQRFMWGWFNPVEVNNAFGLRPTDMPWFPATHLAAWNDASAEAPSTEDRVNAEIVAWASRHPVGSPTGKRGVVNISESELTDAHSKWVFDWVTSQGNGTFQSVGWTRLYEPAPSPPMGRFPEEDFITFTPTGGTADSMGGVALCFDGTVWNVARNNGASAYTVCSAPAAGGALTDLFTPGTWFKAYNGMPLRGITRLGTDFILCGGNQGQGPLARLSRHTLAGPGTQTWARTEAGNTYDYRGVTVDGSSNIWTAGSDGIMRRHSNADGTITASVTPTGFTGLTGIAFDSSDGNFFITGTYGGVESLAKVNSSGTVVGFVLAYYATSQQFPASTSPYAGNYYIPQNGPAEPFVWQPSGTTVNNGAYVSRTPAKDCDSWGVGTISYRGDLALKAGEPWVAVTNSPDNGPRNASPIRGGSLGTRVLLGSPVTKTSSQNMKITYQFTFV
jgi:hypothetical protein